MTRASLPMYWRDENAAQWREFWSILQDCAAREGCPLPDLTAPEDLPTDWHDHWRAPDLALSMTCGLPFRTALKDRVSYVGTLGFGLNCAEGHYHSRVITGRPPDETARTSPADGLRLAYNAANSQSGWAASQQAAPFASAPAFAGFVETGSHAASLATVAEGRADIAYIDAVTWRLLKRHDPNASRVHVAGHTKPTPALPLITSLGTDPTPLRAALTAATTAFAPEDPFALGGPMSFCVLDAQRYLVEPIPAPPPG